MFALKETLPGSLYGATNDSSTIPDSLPTAFHAPDGNKQNDARVPRSLFTATIPNPPKRTVFSSLSNAPFYEDGHLILDQSFKRNANHPDRQSDIWNERVFKRLTNTHLVDIQRIWEGYDGRWIEDAPLLLRFETIDVILAPQARSGALSIWTGYLDTSSSIYRFRNDSPLGREMNQRSCLQWLPYRRNINVIGKRVSKIHLFSLVRTIELSDQNLCVDAAFKRSLFTLSFETGHTFTLANKDGSLLIYIYG